MTDGIRTLVSGAVSDAIFSADGSIVYVAQGGTITAYSTATGAQSNSWAVGTKLGGMDVSADGQTLIAAEREPGIADTSNSAHTIKIYGINLINGSVTTYSTTTNSSFTPYDVLALANGKALISLNETASNVVPLVSLNLESGVFDINYTFASRYTARAIFDPAADHSAATIQGFHPFRGEVSVVAETGSITGGTNSGQNDFRHQAISTAGNLIVAFGYTNIKLYDLQFNALATPAILNQQFDFGSSVGGLALNTAGTRLYVLDAVRKLVVEFDTADWRILRGIDVSDSITTATGISQDAYAYGDRLSISADGHFLSIMGDNKVGIVDLQALPIGSGTRYGTDANDRIVATADFPTVNGLAGNDVLSDGGVSGATLIGGAGGDTYHVSVAGTVVVESDADTSFRADTVYTTVSGTTVSPGVETLRFEPGASGTLFGDARGNALFGADGDDILVGGAGRDSLYGGGGNDVAIIDAPRSSATISVDRITGSIAVNSSAGVDVLGEVETIRFSDGDVSTAPFGVIGTYVGDTLTGSIADDLIMGLDGDDVLSGMAGNDMLDGGLGTDLLDGGDGYDTVIIGATRNKSGTAVRVTDQGELEVTWVGGGVNYGSIGNPKLNTATLRNVEAVRFVDLVFLTGDQTVAVSDLARIGTASADSVTANIDRQVLGGLAGNDVLDAGGFSRIDFYGGAGDDILIAGPGSSRMTGGAGADTFRGTAANLANDFISDFEAGDKIHITDVSIANFSALMRQPTDTLTYTGGSLTLESTLRGIVLSANPNGGVDVMSIARVVQDDFNGDGRSDILWRSNSGQLSDWLGQAEGAFAGNDANAFTNVPINWHVAATGDFNGDGRGDILWRSDSGQLSDWLGQANGSFASNDANAFTSVPTNWHVAGTGDFNGDGRSDILWRSDAGQLSDWLGQANGGFANNDANAFANVSTSWHVAGTGDFNGDGRADILWRNDNGQMSDWLGQANGGFVGNDANAFTSVSTNWHIAGTGDFNGDGRSDILWRSDSGQLSNWLGKVNGGFVGNDANAMVTVPTNWKVVATGDYNGDGHDDILWRSDEGQLSNWLGRNNGGFVSNDANAFTSVPTNWLTQPVHDLII